MTATTMLTPEQILNLPMEDNDSKANTIRGYLKALLVELWTEEEGFSGKRPFGNSGWTSDLMLPLIKAGVITGTLDNEGWINECDDERGKVLIEMAILAL